MFVEGVDASRKFRFVVKLADKFDIVQLHEVQKRGAAKESQLQSESIREGKDIALQRSFLVG